MTSPNNEQPHNSGAGEPSMEEILASIRRILKDESGNPMAGEPTAAEKAPEITAEAKPEAAAIVDEEEDDVFVLDSSMVAKPVDLTSATTTPADTWPGLEEPATEPAAGPHEPVWPSPLPEPTFAAQPSELPKWPATATPVDEPVAFRPITATPPSGTPVFGSRTLSDYQPVVTPPPAEAEPVTTPAFAAPVFPEPLVVNPALPSTAPVFGHKFSPDLSKLPPSLKPAFSEAPFQTLQTPEVPQAPDAAEPEPTSTATPIATPIAETAMPETNTNTYQPPEAIISDQASTAAASAIGAMVRSITAERSIGIARPSLTIDDMVREEIRPLLKAWMDTNLQSVVERVVRAEIEKVVNRSL